MKVFSHHVYEYKKGLRNLVLHTIGAAHRAEVERRLKSLGIAHEIYPLRNGNLNVFFGADACVEVIRSIGKPHLQDYTSEEDFVLGIMLGYCRMQQCRRYLGLRARKNAHIQNAANIEETSVCVA
jgi:hypothetical protein